MKKYLLSILASVLVLGCVKDPEDKVEEPEVTPEPPQPEVVTGKPRYVWIDASANFYYYANDKVFLAAELEKLAGCGFTDIVVDVRPTESTVLWKSSVAPEARRLAAWVNGSYKFVNRTATWDYLQAFIDAGHASGLRVHAAINTFVCGYGGYYGLESEGPVFTGDIPEGWAAMDNTSDGIKSSFYPGVQGTVFMNPANQEVQKYVLNLLKELAAYKVDGIILDRCRYDDTGLQSEFSPESKAAFTEYLGREPDKWPVFGAGSNPSVFSPYQKSWLSFRVKTIHDFVEKAAATVHGVNPDIKFGVYVGAWYSDYYSSGVNWASPGTTPESITPNGPILTIGTTDSRTTATRCSWDATHRPQAYMAARNGLWKASASGHRTSSLEMHRLPEARTWATLPVGRTEDGARTFPRQLTPA